jgi:hypothetical protein
MVYCASTDSANSCPKAGNKGLSPSVPLKQATEAVKFLKTRFNPYMVISNSIGYFTLM